MSEIERVDPRSSIVQIKIGNKLYDAVKSPGCKVCMHPARFLIEEKILMGDGYAKIARWISDKDNRKSDGTQEEWPEIESMPIRNHWAKGHLAIDQAVLRDMVEERAKDLGQDLETSMGRFVDHVVVQKAVLAKGMEALVNGEIKPEVRDMLAASKMLSDREKDLDSSTTIQQWQEFMALYFSAVRQVVDPVQWQQIVAIITNHPVMKAIDSARTVEAY